MKVTFDSNVWETIFNPADHACSPIRAALASGRIEGFICEAAFRVEAVRKSERATYFAQPEMGMQVPGTIVEINGKPHICIASFGPDDQRHPGLPEIQAQKLRSALASGVRLLTCESPYYHVFPYSIVRSTNPSRVRRYHIV